MDVLWGAARNALPEPLKRSLHRWAVQRRIDNYTPRTVAHLYAGEALRISLQDPLAEGWYDHDWGPQAEIEMLRRGRLQTGARIFDLGAHQAVVALVLSRIVGETGEVVAVEAERHNVRVAQENLRLNLAANVTVLHAAAAACSGRLPFSESLNGNVARGRSGSVEVEAVTVDGLTRRFGLPDVVFIDVEGYEVSVLAGADATLEARSTDFFIEMHDAETLARAGATADEAVAALVECGYRCIAVAVTEQGIEGRWREIRSGEELAGRRSYLIATAEE